MTQRHPEVHHSDQGVQYAAYGYVGMLEAAGVQVSMSDVGKPTQNALAERFMCTLKEEEDSLHDYQDYADTRAHIGHFLEDVDMTKRIHSSLGYLTPTEFELDYDRTTRPAGSESPRAATGREARDPQVLSQPKGGSDAS